VPSEPSDPSSHPIPSLIESGKQAAQERKKKREEELSEQQTAASSTEKNPNKNLKPKRAFLLGSPGPDEEDSEEA